MVFWHNGHDRPIENIRVGTIYFVRVLNNISKYVLTREIQFCEWFLYGLQIELGTEKPQIAPHLPFGRDVFHSKWLLWLADRANSIGWDLWNRYWHRCKNTFVLTAKYLFPQCLVRVGFFHDQPNVLKKKMYILILNSTFPLFFRFVILFEFVV